MRIAGILLVDDCRLFREGLKCILSGLNFRIAAEVSSFADALQLLQTRPDGVDLVLGDPGPDSARGFEAVAAIQRQLPDIKIVILADRLTQPWSEPMLRSGADGFLSQDISTEALQHALNLVLTGEQIIPTATPLVSCIPPRPDLRDPPREVPAGPLTAADSTQRQSLSGVSQAIPALAGLGCGEMEVTTRAILSGREKQILDCLVHGLSNKLIARELVMAEATVKVHLKALLRKLKAKNRTQAAIWAIRSRAAEPRVARSPVGQFTDPLPASITEMRPEQRSARGLALDRQSSPSVGRPSALTRNSATAARRMIRPAV